MSEVLDLTQEAPQIMTNSDNHIVNKSFPIIVRVLGAMETNIDFFCICLEWHKTPLRSTKMDGLCGGSGVGVERV